MARNKRRGEVTFKVGSKEYTMCMTLGAMAEIEETFNLESITDLSSVFTEGKFKAKSLIELLGALLRGGGHDIDDDEIANFDMDAVEAFGKAMEAINVQSGEQEKKPVTKKAKAVKRKYKKK